MACLPGFFPVIKDVHATDVIGGKIVSSGLRTLSLISFAIVGNRPSAISGSTKSKVIPSRPIMSIFLANGSLHKNIFFLYVCLILHAIAPLRQLARKVYLRASSHFP